MPALTPEFLMDFESRMTRIVENDYARLSENLWWTDVAKQRPSTSRRELITWMLATAQIVPLGGLGGEMQYSDLAMRVHEYENAYFGQGLKLTRAQFEDTDGDGIEVGTEWSQQIGSYAAYWPQKQIAQMLKDGETGTAYDASNFFATGHKLNPFRDSLGTFANLFTGTAGAGGANASDPFKADYPGAVVLDDSVSVEVALANLSRAIGYIKSIRMPNGDDPRFLRPTMLLGGPRMQARLAQLTNAKFIAQAASSGGGSGDVEALIASFGFTKPIIADELAGYESGKTCFLICEQITASQLGALMYVQREPYKVVQYTGDGGQNVDLARTNELEWQCRGRNVSVYGHPFLAFKLKAT